MSFKSSAPGVPEGRKVLPIRPAVPLIYEPRLRGGGGKPSCKDTLISDDLPNEELPEKVKEDRVPAQSQDTVERSTESTGNKPNGDQLSRSQEEPMKSTEPVLEDLVQETKETEQGSVDVFEPNGDKHEDETNKTKHEKAGSSSRESGQESFEESQRTSSGGECPRPSSQGSGLRAPASALDLG